MAKKKYNFTFFQDILRERRGGKYSSKKVWGFIVMILLCLAFVADGLHFYVVNENLFSTMAILGGTLLGLGTLNLFSSNKSINQTPKEDEIN